MASRLERLYARAPVPLQHAMVTAFGARWYWRRFGPGYRSEVAGFIARERFTREQWRAYQTTQLRELLAIAWTRIPYYQNAWKGLGLDAGAIARFELEDLPQLPIVEKDGPRSEPEAFCVDGKPVPGATITPTSGSSGTPVRVYVTDREFRRSLALREARSCRPAGVSYRMPRATFSLRIVEPDAESRGPFYRFNFIEKQVYYSSFHMSPQNAAAYVEPLNRHAIVWGTGYTNTWDQLATFMLEQGIAPPRSLKAIITTSEKLTPDARARIERAFGCKVFQEYGTTEDAVFASEDAEGLLRHSPDSGILELRRSDGTMVPATSSDEGEAITTSFAKRGQLFIRYRLGDIAAWDQRPDDGGLPILADVVGRVEDVVQAPDGRRTTRFNGVFAGVAGVREAQVVQEARDRLTIRVVPSPSYGEETVHEIINRVHQRLTTAMHVEVEPVDTIPRTAAGKFQAVINRMRP
jgi:phenylacetate-CoA ligase